MIFLIFTDRFLPDLSIINLILQIDQVVTACDPDKAEDALVVTVLIVEEAELPVILQQPLPLNGQLLVLAHHH